MKQVIIRSNLLIILVSLLVGCSPKYYIPNTQNVPMIQAKGQVNITTACNGNQLEVQKAYGLTNAMAVMLSAGFISPKSADNGNGGSGRYVEGGLGYFKNLPYGFLFDTYGLLGVGNMENHFPSTMADHPSTTGSISADIYKYSVQPSLSYIRKYFSIAASARISSLNYSNIHGSLVFGNEKQVDYLYNNRSNFLVEPAITIRAGLEKVKFQVQLLRSFNLTNKDFKQDIGLLTFGMNLNFK